MNRQLPLLRRHIPAWLDTWEFHMFVTLAFNDESTSSSRLLGSSLRYGFLRERLRKWDAFVNHRILGRKWSKRDAERMWSFFFLEKAETNPHWHGVVRFYPIDGRNAISIE